MNRPGNRFENKSWRIFYHKDVVKNDIPKIGKTDRVRIKRAIENRLVINPILYGLPLRATLKRYWKLRVGDWRIVYTIVRQDVNILVIAHRKHVYDIAGKRTKN